MRDLIWVNSPANNTMGDLLGKLREHAATVAEVNGFELHYEVSESLKNLAVSAHVQLHVLSILKEALTNVVKHARAHAVTVTLAIRGDCLTLVVEDDGCELQENAKTNDGNGLRNMRQRAMECGGTFVIESKPGVGTRLEAVFPFKGECAEDSGAPGNDVKANGICKARKLG